MSELRRQVDELHHAKEKMEEELAGVQETVNRATIKLSPRPRQKPSPTQVCGQCNIILV